MTRATARLGYAAAAVLALIGVALRVVPVSIPSVSVEPDTTFPLPERPTGEEQAATLLSFNDIVNGNLFDPTRSAAEERYTPPELAGSFEPEAPTRSGPARFVLRLFGTAVGPEGSVALIDADPAVPGAEVYRVGDRVRGARLVEIRDAAVVLEGSAGRFTLSLPTTTRRSP